MTAGGILLAILLFHPASASGQGNGSPEKKEKPAASRYINQECGFELTRLADWKVTVKPNPHPRGSCDLVVTLSQTSTDKSLEKHSINVLIVDKDYESAIRSAGLVQKDGLWQTEGRQSWPAEEIHGETWIGLNAPTMVGCFDEHGYAGLGQAPSAVLNNKAKKSALIDTGDECDTADDVGFDLFLKSFEFVH
jgi:hypothetical protein